MASTDRHTPRMPDNNNERHTWHPLYQLNIYRLILAAVFLIAFYENDWLSFLGSQHPQAYQITTFSMLFASLIFLIAGVKRWPGFEAQVILSNAGDILFITLLSHFSGGLSSPLSILLIINVAATGTFLKNRDSFLFAALASIAILSEQTYSMLQGLTQATEYSRAGLLGLVFFGTSFLASILSKRLRESEQLASEREADILSLEKLNKDIIQNMRTGIIVVDKDGCIRMANSSAELLLGSLDPKDRPRLVDILPALGQRLEEWKQQPGIHHKAIQQAHGLPDIQPGFRRLHGTDDTLIFLEDATQLNQRFQQIKLASLGRLTASIAHEIRNPLSAINHATQLLQEAELNAADRKLTQIITTQVQRLDRVIENVLQLSRQQKGDAENINLNQWLKDFRQNFLTTSKLQANQFQLDAADKDINVLFDTSHLEQVMCNLCNNAVTHNNRPLNDIRIRLDYGYDSQLEQPFIRITDNGPGISQKIAAQIFDPFFTTSTSGTGLGLYITKEIIESNRGKIFYTDRNKSEQQPDDALTGSCFTILFLEKTEKN